VFSAKGDSKKLPTVAELTVRESGEARRVLAFEPLGPGAWRFVIYVDRVLSSSRNLRAALGGLAARAAALTALGTVEVVMAEPTPSPIVPATHDPYVVEETLSRLAYGGTGLDGIRTVRRRFRDEAAGEGVPEAATPADSGAAAGLPGLAEEAAEEEVRLVRRQQDNLAGWLAGQPGDRPAVLFLVADGWDRDPREFYRPAAKAAIAGIAPSAGGDPFAPFTLEADSTGLARAIAALGWTAVPLAVGDAPLPDLRRPLLAPSQNIAGGTVTLPEHDKAREAEKEQEKKAQEKERSLLPHPLDPLRELAEASGGELIVSPLALPDLIARLRGRLRLRYEGAPVADGRTREVSVQATSPEWTLRTRRYTSAGTPPELAALRARRLLDGEEGTGDLPVAADLRFEAGGPSGRQAQVDVRLNPGALPAGALPETAALRLTVAAPEGTVGTHLLQRPLEPADAVEGEPWAYHLTIPLPGEADRLAVVVDLPASGLWGGELAAVVTGEAASAAESPRPASPQPGPDVVRFLEPGRQPLSGRVKVATRVTGPGVARLVFKVDGKEAGTAVRAPWEAEVNFGRTGRPHTLEVLAFSATGVQLGRDMLRVNRPGEAPGGARVRILQPASGKAGGPVDVEAEVRLPAERRVERVEFFWNEELAATLYQPPYRHRVPVPPNRPGYLRVAARLDDGTTAEDAVPMNTAGASERVDVQLVQLFVVVTDRAGRPVKGLSRADFKVREDGHEQALAGFDDAGDFPITVGLAVDTSASMFVKLPGVVKAAQSLVGQGLTGRDSALLVGFDVHPRLLMRPTRDRGAVTAALDTLRPDGGTGLWGAIDFSLSQLQTVSGRRALIVYSDGIEEEEEVAFSTSLRRARESGIPIYLLFTNAAAAHEGKLLGRLYTGRLERLTAAAGGKLYFVEPDQDLAAVYREILSELRSQYVLTYYPKEVHGDAWREIQVEMAKKGLTARTIRGYYPEP